MNKSIIIFSVVLLLAVIALMAYDLFFNDSDNSGNPYEYDLGDLRKVDESLICYKETSPINPGFGKLKALAVDDSNKIYVGGDRKLKVFKADGIIENEFNIDGAINCMAIGGDGRLFLGMTDHIEVMDQQGRLLLKWDALNDRVFITSIAVDGSSVYLADAGNKIVYRYNNEGLLLNTIGKKDKEHGIPGFVVPSPYFDLAVGREGQLWVVNPGLHTFEAYNREGGLFSSWTKTSMQIEGFSGCCNPGNFAVLDDGSFVTSEKGIERVKIHLPSGEFKCVVAAPDSFEEGTIITDLAVDLHGRILVLDPRKGLIRIFEGK